MNTGSAQMIPTLIENGRVFGADTLESRVQPIVFAERIVATGADALAFAEQQPEIHRIDASGMTVMPGLIDAHCHISFDEPHSNDELFFHRREGLAAIVSAYNAQKLLRAGVTSIFDADTIFNVSLDLRDAIEAGITPGPRMTCGGNALFTSVGGTAGMLVPDEGAVGYLKVTRTRDEIVTEIRQQAKRGVDWIKIHVTGLIPRQRGEGEIQVWNAEELKLAADTAHELGLPIVGHCRNASSTRDAANAGFDMILHATYMDEAALEAVVKAKVPIVPTLTFQAVLADHGPKVGASAFLQDLFAREVAESSKQLRRAWDAGVPILCGSESGFSITPYGEWHWRELQVLVENLGLSAPEALVCATREGARAMRMADQIGTLEVGRLADVIVVRGDVTTDVTLLGRPDGMAHVFKQGRRIDIETPLPERLPLPSWRVSTYSQIAATRAAVQDS
ncbi:metal-dependent hydrolase family protein [Sphingosinicella microcystinivorans]|uniref:Dipeptidase n=1 Tax=Sphingosinicella microcystinivorans TaxID=335406 RepID=A0AAD1D8S4_SPHMI|nr:amidohydrolase family protein [Sphingosinicella microcystinivorans]RKS86300.1 imidazolonepropionase-like amidohydrolase [Sphingosinicella microcystinivorans]BBE35655.1 dipeptidase [Sphingosinicella microcystinivorans]